MSPSSNRINPGSALDPRIPAGWAACAADLAAWAWERLVNRTDVWGGYVPLEDRGKERVSAEGEVYKLGATLTRPARAKRGKILLTRAVLERHFRARGPRDVMGLHTTSPEQTSKWGSVEIDHHGEQGTPRELTWKAARGWYAELRHAGYHPLLTDSNGDGGYHLDVIYNRPVPTPDLYHFLRKLTANHFLYGLSAQPETFPKQPRLRPRADGRPVYGNWKRVPGRHHTRDHWSRVWDGDGWLEGAEAAGYILGLTGDPPELLPTGLELEHRVRGYLAKLPNRGEGQGRDDVAYQFACWLARDMELPDAEALRWLGEWDCGNRPPKGAERLAEILGNARNYGQRPFGAGRLTDGPIPSPSANGTGRGHEGDREATEPDPGDAPPESKPEDRLHLTDTGNARRLVRRYGDRFRHCHPWSKDLVWDGKRWREDDTAQLERFAKETVASIYAEALAADPEDRKVLAAHALRSESAKLLGWMMKLARSEPGIPVLPDQLDRSSWLFNAANGTIDLQTGRLRGHDRADLLTKLSPTRFDPDADCPTWTGFLHAIFGGDEDLIAFMQRSLGRCLSGDVSEQVLPICWGGGANGKTTMFNAVMATMGTAYSMIASPDLLLTSHGERHPTELAQLFGMRLVVASETNQGRRLNESLVKQLVGSDRIRARRMREDFWEFDPTHKVFLFTNHKPTVSGTDHGVWRRLRLVPFEKTFWNPDDVGDASELPPELRQDKQLPAKLFAEREGILAWLVRGCLDWQKYGLPLPDKVRVATTVYRESQDLVALFLAECCQVGNPNYRCKASDLYDSFKLWQERSGEGPPISQRRFGDAMTERGYERLASNGTWYLGVGLNSNQTTQSN